MVALWIHLYRFPKNMLPFLQLPRLRFLQMNLPGDKRENYGLRAVFESVFPITDLRETCELQFVDYAIGNWECKCGALEGSHNLVSHCSKYHEEGAEEDRIFCVRYIQGFIDGAVATDERVTRNVAMEYEKEESFSERAKRTRVGSRLERYGATVYADYCLGDPVPLREVVEHVVEDSRDEKLVAEVPLARELVYRTLRTHYPCVEQNRG